MAGNSPDVLRRAGDWLMGHDTGASSQALCARMIGAQKTAFRYATHPSDPADFGRCARLLRAIPEWRNRLDEMRPLSPQWNALVERWDDIHASLESECGLDWEKSHRAPKTYQLMAGLLAAARKPA